MIREFPYYNYAAKNEVKQNKIARKGECENKIK